MSGPDPTRRLSKELALAGVFSISIGATLSSGFFLLPGLAAAEAGPALPLAYLIAMLPLIPGILSKVELATAMPRAGGVYYFLDRAVGPAAGTIGGIGTWLALVLKVAFALVGMGAYLGLLWADAPMETLAVALAILFGLINWLGARKTGRLQVVLVSSLLVLVAWFIGTGVTAIEPAHFDGFFNKGADHLLAAAGLVCVSYIGLSKVASVSEEVKDPEKNLPRGMFLAILATIAIYVGGTIVMIGVLQKEDFYAGEQPDLTPVASAASVLAPGWGGMVMTIAALLAFFSVANAGILSASRYPLAMSRDRLMPGVFDSLGRFGTPGRSIAMTTAMVILAIIVLDPLKIAKLAAAFQLLLFAMNCVAVIVMRESGLESYDPGFRLPLYPWTPILGMVAPFVLIGAMGLLPIIFSTALIGIGLAWYFFYGKERVSRQGAILQVFRRMGEVASEHELDVELRTILKEKGLRDQDPFEEIMARAVAIDLSVAGTFEDVVEEAAGMLARRLPCTAQHLIKGFLEGTRTGMTPVTGGVALPHMRIEGIEEPEVVFVRCLAGIDVAVGDVFGGTHTEGDTVAIFFLVSPESNPAQHLRLLAQLARRVDDEGFLSAWRGARDTEGLKQLFLQHDRFYSLRIDRQGPVSALIDRRVSEMQLPDGCLVALIRREREAIVPQGSTRVREGDQLMIIGSVEAIGRLRAAFGTSG